MIKYRLFLLVLLAVFALAGLGLLRLDFDTDVVRSLPSGEKILADGLDIFEHHPIHDQIGVDIMIDGDDPDTLVAIGASLEKSMRESGLFAQVGTEAVTELIPELASFAAKNLPLLFSREELEEKVAPLLKTTRINQHLRQQVEGLGQLEGIGQAGFLRLDPLGLKDLVLARMAPLAPSLTTRFYRGSLLSADSRHLLVTARPRTAGTNTATARSIADLLSKSSRDIKAHYASAGRQVTITPVGAYRAALDNERIIRHDVQLALVLATVAIGLLLFVSFPRPLIGLLALLPALAGTGIALFVYSLLHSSISIMVLGFGGAIISITVDLGIVYLLFLDRPHETRGKDASHEVLAIGILAVVTTIGAFLILSTSGFPIFTELGQFSSLGIFFSFLFVHSIFPRIFPAMPAAGRRSLPLRGLVNGFYRTGRSGAIGAVLLAGCLLFFARPQFHVSLDSMNTVSKETLAADALFTKVWGSIGTRVLLMYSAPAIGELQEASDTLVDKIDQDLHQEILSGAFVPSMIFPGSRRSAENLRDWHAFWDKQKREQVIGDLQTAGEQLGFRPDAFADFFALLDPAYTGQAQPIPTRYFGLLGISKNKEDSNLIQFVTVLPGKRYDATAFQSRYGDGNKIFDAAFFTKRLAEILFGTFTTMLAIIAVSVSLLLFFFYLNLRLTLLTLLPPFFAYICTLGTLNIIGHPLDIPALMLSVVILGMGVDYSIYCVRAHQRYRDVNHPSYVLVRVAVFMAGTSTLIGFGVLAFAEHSLLRSIGITSLLGIGYSLLGSFLLLPPLLDFYIALETKKIGRPGGKDIAGRIRDRFRTLEPYPRMFARFKLHFDPLFKDLPRMLSERQEIQTIIDIGCGYGVPACWCLEQYPQAEVYGIDPDAERVRVAALATCDRGRVTTGWAPELPVVPRPADIVLLLDMLHYLDDETTAALFGRTFQALGNNGILVTRFALPAKERPSWSWRLEDSRIKIAGRRPWYRSAERIAELMRQAGFVISVNEVSAGNPELVWMVCRAEKETTGVEEHI